MNGLSFVTNYLMPSASAVASGVMSGFGVYNTMKQKAELAEAQRVTTKATSQETEVGSALARTGQEAIKSANSRLWRGVLNIGASVCNTVSSGVTLVENIVNGPNENEKQEGSPQHLVTTTAHAVTAGANGANFLGQAWSAGKAFVTYYRSADPTVRVACTLSCREQTLRAIASAAQAVGSAYSSSGEDNGSAATAATIFGTTVTAFTDLHYNPKIREFLEVNSDNLPAVRILSSSQGVQLGKMMTKVQSQLSQDSLALSPQSSQVSLPLPPQSSQGSLPLPPQFLRALELSREHRGEEVVQIPKVQDPILRVEDPVLDEERAYDEERDLPLPETVIEIQPLAQGKGASSPEQSLEGRDPAESLF